MVVKENGAVNSYMGCVIQKVDELEQLGGLVAQKLGWLKVWPPV